MSDEKKSRAKLESVEPVDDRQSVEFWGKKLEIFPERYISYSDLFDPEGHLLTDATRGCPGLWKFRAAMAFKGWPSGKLVTEEEFSKAIEEASGARVG